MTPPPLRHADPSRPDDRLAADAAAHLGRSPGLQLVAELYARLRDMDFPWWTGDQLRDAFPAVDRLGWLAERPDLRQRITTQLTGLAPRAARNKSPEFQAQLIDSVIDEGDITVAAFEAAFEPADIAVYGPAADIFRLFRRRMPWDDDATAHQDLVGWLIGALLADRSSLDGSARTPVLSVLQVRTSIDGRVWHSRIPLHVRVAIDEARFAAQRERPSEPYGVERDLAIATPALIAASIPLRDLMGVIDVATNALGFDEGGAHARGHGREPATRSSPARAESDDAGPRALENERAPPSIPPEPPEPPRRVSVAPVERPASIAPPPVEASVDSPSESPSAEPPAAEPPAAEPPATAFAEEETSGPSIRDSIPDELEHTNPWLVPQLSSDIEKAAAELREGRDKHKIDSEETK
ncbi:MAG: hypothetical protein IPM79_13430 [Polyangiaceae bacterium]|nr:hypothetical protein [Polyangiaceae bacterium]MBK8938599.1 hypothetical protein [Polyangiaceae bacterium]